VAVSVHEGDVADSQTLLPEVQRLLKDFGIEHLLMVRDRGMISSQAIAELRDSDGVPWITALKSRPCDEPGGLMNAGCAR
jgi:transposase